METIVTLTLNPAVDGSADAEVVRPTHKIRTTNERYDPGGGGINVSRVIQSLGGDALAVYLAGGATGSVLDELLDARGLRRLRLPIRDHTRVSHAVHERSTGLEYRFVPEGPLVAEAEWTACLSTVADLDWHVLVASGSLARGVPEDVYVRLQRLAAGRGGKLVLDTSGPALKAALQHGGLYLVKPSIGEFESLVGRTLGTKAEVGTAAADLVTAGRAEIVAVTLGHEGAVLATAGETLYLPAPDVEARSAVGAGDSFVAAMTYALSLGRPAAEALALGVAAGSAAVLSPGNDLCAKPDVDRLFEVVNGTAVRL
ncbi:1-phosphofructokinase family hexose kinase [Chthonobacter rhizosphaerae]|uniref:1-phosphofructokinase family hexose kinase n=1 Tax=Chthonobacter rhizosphaerae TaxID=2735553 RepID=UPI0015EF4711|nr:1-phosphofructokinase family hexose kinase [Chthonobacter rhizosphaerae]